MIIIKGISKLVLKIIVLPLILFLTIATFFANMALNLGAYIFGPLLTIIFCIIIYTVCKQTWYHTGLLSAIEAGIAILYFGAAWIVLIFEDLRNSLIGFIKN